MRRMRLNLWSDRHRFTQHVANGQAHRADDPAGSRRAAQDHGSDAIGRPGHDGLWSVAAGRMAEAKPVDVPDLVGALCLRHLHDDDHGALRHAGGDS